VRYGGKNARTDRVNLVMEHKTLNIVARHHIVTMHPALVVVALLVAGLASSRVWHL
jgi:hypothetical protein